LLVRVEDGVDDANVENRPGAGGHGRPRKRR